MSIKLKILNLEFKFNLFLYPTIKKKSKDKVVNKFLKNLVIIEGLGVLGGFKLRPGTFCKAERWR